VTLCEAVAWLATGKACSGKALQQMTLSDDIPDDVQTGQKIELAGCLLWDAFGENDLPIFGYRVNDCGEPSAGIEQIPSEKFLSRRTTTAPPMGVVDDTISIGGTTYEGVTMRRSDLLRLWPASTLVDVRIISTVDVATVSQAPDPIEPLRGGGPLPPGRPQITPKGMEWILGFIEETEDARHQLYDGDVVAFKRSRDGRLWEIPKTDWGDDRVWDRARTTGHVLDTVVVESPVFIKKGAEQPAAATDGTDLGQQEDSKRRKTRRSEPQTDAEVKSKITAVLSDADREWPTPEKRPPTAYQAAGLLVAGQPGHRLHGYSEVTVRKILAGTYNPMSKHGLTGRY